MTTIDSINVRLAALQAAVNRIQVVSSGADTLNQAQSDWQSDINTNWLMVTFALVFAMQIGLALYEAGNARRRNFLGIIIKNIAATSVTGLTWWFWGWALSFGYFKNASANGFVGNADLLLVTDRTFPIQMYAFWAFQWAFANLSTHIIFGATAERLSLFGTYAYSFLYSGFIYPIVAHWIWSQSGWFSPSNTMYPRIGENGLIDFSGATVVHLAGGLAALAGAWQVGARTNRFESEEGEHHHDNVAFNGNSQVLKYLGTLILWFGWYGFTCGSSYTVSLYRAEVIAKVAINTTLSAGAGGILIAIISRAKVGPTTQGILAGLVSISGAVSVVEPWAAVVIGIIGGGVYQIASNVVAHFHIDDATNAFAVHGAAGIWGTLAVGIFATQYNTQRTLNNGTAYYGFLYGGGGNQFGTQFFGALVVAAWAFFWTTVFFIIFKAIEKLQVPEETQALATDPTQKSEAYVAAYLGVPQAGDETERRQLTTNKA